MNPEKLSCFGCYDPDDTECQTFCVFQTRCEQRLFNNLVAQCKTLEAQKNQVDLNAPILQHFHNIFEKLDEDSRSAVTNSILNTNIGEVTPWNPSELSINGITHIQEVKTNKKTK